MGKTITQLDAVADYVSVDIETTGLDVEWCEIIEVAAVRIVNGNRTASYTSLVRPTELPIPDFIENLTGIHSTDLESAPTISAVMPKLLAFIGSLPIVGHNVCFDHRFIKSYGQQLELEIPTWELIDTMRIARHVFGMDIKRDLDSILKMCEDEAGQFALDDNHHRALYDSIATSFCYEAMKPLLVAKYGNNTGKKVAKRTMSQKPKSRVNYKDMKTTVSEFDESNPFFGTSICFTGTLSKMTRSEAIQKALDVGALPQPSVTKKLDYLVVGSFDFNASLKGKPSSKILKAQKYAQEGIPLRICSERFFESYIN